MRPDIPYIGTPISFWDKRVLLMMETMEREGLFSMSAANIAARLGTSPKQVENTCRSLKRKGYLRIERPGRGGRNPLPQIWRLTYVPVKPS